MDTIDEKVTHNYHNQEAHHDCTPDKMSIIILHNYATVDFEALNEHEEHKENGYNLERAPKAEQLLC